MKLELIRSNRNPVHVSVFEDQLLNIGEWNVINIQSLPMPINIRRITFDVETDIEGSFYISVRVTRGSEFILLAGNSMLELNTTLNNLHAWLTLAETASADSAISSAFKVSPLPKLGLSNFDSIDVYPSFGTATPIRMTVYLGWSYQ